MGLHHGEHTGVFSIGREYHCTFDSLCDSVLQLFSRDCRDFEFISSVLYKIRKLLSGEQAHLLNISLNKTARKGKLNSIFIQESEKGEQKWPLPAESIG